MDTFRLYGNHLFAPNLSLTKTSHMNFRRNISLLFILFSIGTSSFSQDAPKVHMKNGIGIVSSDSLFAVNIRFRMQNRIGGSLHQEDGETELSTVEFRTRRVRLRFDGHLWSPKLQYALQLSFSRGDQDWDNSGVPNVLRDAMIFYEPNANLRLGFGQGKLPGNRQRVISSGEQQLVDRSLVNARLNVDRDFGIFAHYRIKMGKPALFLRGAISSGEGRNEGVSKSEVPANTGLCYTGRIEILPFGLFTNKNDYTEGDQAREPKPKISLAGGISFNDNAVRSGGQLGKSLYEQKDISTFIFDGVFKYRGFALGGEYLKRITPGGSNVTVSEAGAKEYVYVGEGYNAQGSYLFKSNYEIIGQFVKMMPLNETRASSSLGQIVQQYTLGITKYLKGHRIKLQFDTTYEQLFNSNDKTLNSNNVYARFQIELGI
jgi:phosphate-selective porin OprO and OprP